MSGGQPTIARLRQHCTDRKMASKRKEQTKEDRITDEIVVDAYDASKRAMGWYYYLEEKLQFLFTGADMLWVFITVGLRDVRCRRYARLGFPHSLHTLAEGGNLHGSTLTEPLATHLHVLLASFCELGGHKASAF